MMMARRDKSWTSDPSDKLARERRRLESDRRELLAEREKLEAEKAAMAKSGVADGDVLKLNVGGEMFTVQRGTLLLASEDSHLHAMFSGRWEESLSRTEEGAIFVEMTPQVFRVILSRLRSAKLKLKPPLWGDLRAEHPVYEDELQSVLKFFGLLDPVLPPPFVMDATDSGIDVVGGLVLTKKGFGHSTAISSESVTVGSVWKIHIRSLLPNHWIFAGIVGASAAPNRHPFNNPSSFGWARQVYVNGAYSNGLYGLVWTGWQANDTAIFKLENTRLKMYHMRLGRTFALPLSPESLWKVHFNMHGPGSKIEVLGATNEEVACLE